MLVTFTVAATKEALASSLAITVHSANKSQTI